MKILLAGGHVSLSDVAYDTGVPYIMGSYYYMEPSPTDGSGEYWKVSYRDHDNCKGIMVDSGAFTFIRDGSPYSADDIDWHAYAESYAEFVAKHDIKRWIELDLDGPKSYDFALELRELMTDIVGRPPIPVWHRSRGVRNFKQMCDDHDFVAMGGFPWDEIRPDEYHYLHKFINEAHKRGARIHGLGFQGDVETLERYPFDSTDSTNWIWDSFGSMRRFDGRRLTREYHDGSSKPALYDHNIREWAKFARYMDGRNEPAIDVEW